jgi:hypothetical protein
MAPSAILLVDVANDGLAALELYLCHPHGLASLNYKMWATDDVVFRGLKRPHTDLQPGECRGSNVRPRVG